MKSASILIVSILGAVYPVSAFSETTAAESPAAALIEKYSGEYCRLYNFCGPLVAYGSCLYAEQFYERLRTTPDQELKRLTALTYLSSEIEAALNALEKGIVQEGKLPARKLKKTERGPGEAHVREMLHDLAIIDTGDSKKVVAELNDRLTAAVKAWK